MVSGHTPGPWRISCGGRCGGDDGFSIATDRVGMIAECWPCVILGVEHQLEISANAALISAAPELLDALIACEDRLSRSGNPQDWPALDKARAIIAKATGEGA